METNLRDRGEIDITDISINELKEVSKEHPDGYIKNKQGRILWVYTKNEDR